MSLMDLGTSEIIPYIIGSLITLALIKWLFSKVDDRPITSPSLYFSYSPDPEALRELQGMFPNIPRAYIVRELDRADGAIPVAIDNLLLMVPDFINLSGSANDSSDRLDTTPLINSTTHHNLINSMKQNCGEGSQEPLEEEVVLNKKNWDKVDPQTRLRILADRKRKMLMKARESFINTK